MIIDSIKDRKVKSDPRIVIRNCSVIYLFLGKEMDGKMIPMDMGGSGFHVRFLAG